MVEGPQITQEPSQIQTPSPVRWSMEDAWMGVGAAFFMELAAAVVVTLIRHSNVLLQTLRSSSYFEPTAVTALELVELVPVILILAWRRADWRSLGFRKFNGNVLGLGCGLLALTYMGLMVYGAVLVMLHIKTQGESLMEIMRAAQSPWGLAFAAVVAAPFAEEIFFRGFVFQGLRQKWGSTRAILVSSLVFGLMHLQPAALIPTFALGCVLAYVYEKSNSLWPGMILHFLVNGFAMCAVLATMQLSGTH